MLKHKVRIALRRWRVVPIMVGGALTLLTAATPLQAVDRSPLQGSRIVRIDDGTAAGQCIHQDDRLTVTLRSGTLEKQSRWLGLIEDTELGLTLTTTVTGSTGAETRSASFAKVVKENVTPYRTGQIAFAQEHSLLSRYPLTNGTNVFSVVDLEIGIVRAHGRSVAAKILLGAVNTTKDLNLPVNPFTSAYGIATSYVNSVFSPLLDQAAADKEGTSAHITMNIDAAQCAKDDERTGTKMVVFAVEDTSRPGAVDIGHLEAYCWKINVSPSVEVLVAPRANTVACTAARNFVSLQNSYLAFMVNALPSQPLRPNAAAIRKLPTPRGLTTLRDAELLSPSLQQLGISSASALGFAKALVGELAVTEVASAYGVSSRTVDTYREAVARCRANRVSLSECF